MILAAILAQTDSTGGIGALFPLVAQSGIAGLILLVMSFQIPKLFNQFRDYHEQSQAKFQAQIDKLDAKADDRERKQDDRNRTLLEQLQRNSESQNLLTRDVIVALKLVEQTVTTQGSQVRAIEKTVDNLGVTVSALATLANQVGGSFWPSRSLPPDVANQQTDARDERGSGRS